MHTKHQNTSKATILVVDDTPHNLDVLRSILAQRGHKVWIASNGELALKSAQTNSQT